MQQEDYVGSIFMAANFNYSPSYRISSGVILSVNEYSALYSLFGTNYGGDGRGGFGVPDLRARSAVGAGRGPGLRLRSIGSRTGAERIDLYMEEENMPAHTHSASFPAGDLDAVANTAVESGSEEIAGTLSCDDVGFGQPQPQNAYPATAADASYRIWSATHDGTHTAEIPIRDARLSALRVDTDLTTSDVPVEVTPVGEPVSEQSPFVASSRQPSLGICFVIAVEGKYPSRNAEARHDQR